MPGILYRLLRLIFSLYALCFFVLSFFIVMPCYFFIFNVFNEKLAPHVAHRVSRFWARLLFAGFFIKPKINNTHFVDASKTYVFVGNHRSFLDIPLFAISCKNTFRFLAKAELTRIPLMGYVIKKLYISVWRGDKKDRSKSMEAMKNSLYENVSVFLCPEGTRNKTDKPLLDFKDGAFRLALKAQTPVAVLTIVNSDKLLSPLRPAEMRPGIIHASWSEPIETKGMTEDDLDFLREKVKKQMLEHLA